MDELQSERLSLRAWRPGDFDDFAALCADPEGARYVGDGTPMNRVKAWRAMAVNMGHWQIRGYGRWIVELRDSGAFCGVVGFIDPEGWPDFELGWSIKRSYWGQGIATEAARVARNYAFTTLRRPYLIHLIDPDNLASIRVEEKIGARLDHCTEFFDGTTTCVYRTDAPAA